MGWIETPVARATFKEISYPIRVYMYPKWVHGVGRRHDRNSYPDQIDQINVPVDDGPCRAGRVAIAISFHTRSLSMAGYFPPRKGACCA
jgi:hypothetical protein